jgi:hypothetical protein
MMVFDAKINRKHAPIWNHQEEAAQLVRLQKMEVPETSVSHFAFWLSAMPEETESAEVNMGQLLPMQVGDPFKTTAACHGRALSCEVEQRSCWCF